MLSGANTAFPSGRPTAAPAIHRFQKALVEQRLMKRAGAQQRVDKGLISGRIAAVPKGAPEGSAWVRHWACATGGELSTAARQFWAGRFFDRVRAQRRGQFVKMGNDGLVVQPKRHETTLCRLALGDWEESTVRAIT